MGSKTVTTYYCDACEAELPQGTYDDVKARGLPAKTGAVDSKYTLQFAIAVDDVEGPRYRNSYSMLCDQCKTDLINVIDQFHKSKAPVRR